MREPISKHVHVEARGLGQVSLSYFLRQTLTDWLASYLEQASRIHLLHLLALGSRANAATICSLHAMNSCLHSKALDLLSRLPSPILKTYFYYF